MDERKHDLAAAYHAIGEELDIPVADVGIAFLNAGSASGTSGLYNTDQTHPSYKGSYLAAMTLFAKIFGVDPLEVEFNGKLSESDAQALKEAARDAVFNTPEIPEEWQTTSEGVTAAK